MDHNIGDKFVQINSDTIIKKSHMRIIKVQEPNYSKYYPPQDNCVYFNVKNSHEVHTPQANLLLGKCFNKITEQEEMKDYLKKVTSD